MKYWFREHAFSLGILVLFCVSFVLGVWLINGSTFADPDSFYHVTMAERIANGDSIREFPWLPFTVLGDYFADQHFLYHVFLAPFVKFIGPFVGAKLATVFLASAFIVMFVMMLRAAAVRFPLVYGVVLMTLTPFLFRLYLVKAPAFSLLLLCIGMAAAWKKRWIVSSIISFVYVWSYGGFVLLPLVVLWLTIVRLVSRYVRERRYLRQHHVVVKIQWRAFVKHIFDRVEMRVLYASFLGMIAGVFTHPFFPNILRYVNDQLIQIGIKNYQDIIGVGREWYPFDPIQLIANNILLTVLFLVGVALIILSAKKMSARSLFFLPLFLGGLVFTLKSSRYIEYYVPFGLAFAASMISDYFEHVSLPALRRAFTRLHVWEWIAGAAFILFVAASLGYVIPRDMRSIHNDLQGGFSYTQGKAVSLWLADHSRSGDVVIHSDWDDFPYLLYWNRVNRYIAGLDPTFLYRAGEDRYWTWVNLTIGKTRNDIAEIAKTTFNARYVLIERDHEAFLSNAKKDTSLTSVYEDDQYVVFSTE